jgi:WD40 repeat protein
MTPDDPDARLADLLAAYDDALAGGTAPPEPASDIWPHLDPAARDRLADNRTVLDLLERVWPRSGSSSRPAPPIPDDALPCDFGRFRARRKLGAGGCGVVFLADDPVLGRPIALKVPRPDVLASPDLGRRFLREARTAALLAHPNIVPVFEASAAGGVCYIAAEFCPGPTLARWLADHPPPGPRAAAAHAAALADAMGYAHHRGVVHRDLKPSNVLLFGAGSTGVTGVPPDPDAALDDLVPKVTDFGFAKLLERDDDATRTGTVIGTPQYMAPEQAEGRLSAVGPATDVYALGVILYEVLTGRPPIKGATTADTLRRLVYTDPPRPRAVRPDCPRDLEAVVLKCLEKNPAKRYPDGAALANDLQRFLAGEPTRARPVGWAERAAKWARRNPLVASLAAVVAVAAAGMAALGAAYNRHLADRNAALEAALTREHEQGVELDRQRRLADDRAAAAARQAYLAQMRYLGGLARAGRGSELAAAWAAGPAAVGDDLRGFEWHYLARLGREGRVWREFGGPVEAVALSADGRRAAAHAAGEVRVWDPADGRVLARWDGLAGSDWLFLIAPDGRTLVAPDGPFDGKARPNLVALDVATGDRRVIVPRVGDNAYSVGRFLPDGRLLTPAGDGSAAVVVLDPRTGRRSAECGRPGWDVWAAAPAGDGSAVVAVLHHQPTDRFQAVVFDPATGRATDLPGAAGVFSRLWVSPDGRHVAFRQSPQLIVRVWDRVAGREVAVLKFDGREVSDGAFLADGRLVLAGWGAGDAAGIVHLGTWSPADSRWEAHRVEPGCKVRSLAFAPDGRRLLIGGMDNAARVVEAVPPAPYRAWDAHTPAEAWALAISPDGRTVVTGGDEDGHWTVAAWDARTGRLLARREEHGSLVTAAAFAPDGRTFATASFDGTVRVWDAATYAVRRVLRFDGDLELRAVAYSPDGTLLAAAAGGKPGGGLAVWEAATGRPVWATRDKNRVRDMVFTADGREIITGDGDALRWWAAADGRPLRAVPETAGTGGLTRTPDGRELVVATEAGQVVVRGTADGAEHRRVFGPPVRLTAVAVSPDGKTVATAGLDGAVRLRHAATGDELFPLLEPGPPVYAVAFSPDGTQLAAVRHDGRLYIWTTTDP